MEIYRIRLIGFTWPGENSIHKKTMQTENYRRSVGGA
jgi:hypothetical protein